MRFDIVSIGSATVDLFVDTDCELINISGLNNTESLIAYPTGSKILIKKRSFHLGGGGTNAAATFSKFGLKTGYIGKIANDEYGNMILTWLKKNRINLLAKQSKGNSGFSVILDSIAHDRTILAYKGINNKLLLSDISKYDTDWIYATSMTGKSWITLQKLIKNTSAKIVLNPSSYLVKDERKKTLELLKYVYGLIFNLEEAKLLLEINPNKNVDPFHLLNELKIFGLKFVVITDGARGIYGIEQERYRLKPRKVKVVESTGAGDAFGSALTGALVKGKTFRDSLMYGLANAESVIGKVGAKEGILSYYQLTKNIKKRKPRVTRK